MKKIGILTLFYRNYNFGGQLQAYALVKYLSKMRYEVEQIQFDYQPHSTGKLYDIKRKLALQKHRIFNVELYKDEIKAIKRKKEFDSFISSIPHSSKVFQENNIFASNTEYDYFVCGGDQIWNDWNDASWICSKALSIFSLGFVENDKIAFSYAPSLGRSVLTDNQKNVLAESFRRMNGISIREKSNLDEVSCLTDKIINVVVDPVFLLTCEEWNTLINNKTKRNGDYAFCYFLSNDFHRTECVNNFVKSNGLITICVPNSSGNMFVINREEEWGDINDYESGPIDFIERIRDSKIVLTDSFHAVAFSIIFHKEFYVFGRSDGYSEMNNRIYDLLDEYDLADRYISNAMELLSKTNIQINYLKVDNILMVNREASMQYLKNCLTDL